MNSPANRKPAIWADAMQLATSIEQAVRHFPRYHKYALGSDLRRQAAHICRLVAQAARFPERRLATLERLVLAVEDLKISIQLRRKCKPSPVLPNFSRSSNWRCGWADRAVDGGNRRGP